MKVQVTNTVGKTHTFFVHTVGDLKDQIVKKWRIPRVFILVEHEDHILIDAQEFSAPACVTLALRVFENQPKPLAAALRWVEENPGEQEVWAEDIQGACKRYPVATKAEMQYYLDKKKPEDRHVYEIILGENPVRLYLDIDGKGITDVGNLRDNLRGFLYKFIDPAAQVTFRELTSHREGVFSMHLIAVVTIKGQEWLWETAYQAGEVVHQFVAAFPVYKAAIDELVYNKNR